MTVDDLTGWFVRSGSGWHQGNTGHDGHHYWVPARASGKTRSGVWRATLAEAGLYRVQVMMAPYHGTTRKAAYKLRTAAGWTTAVRNQFKNRGKWVNLGVYELTQTPMVILTDVTGERDSLRRRVAFDAIRFIPVVAAAVNSDDSSRPTTNAASSDVLPVEEPRPTAGPKPAAEPKPTAEPAPTAEPTTEPSPRQVVDPTETTQ